jgi:spermidine/putrescine transport system permease protein
MPTPRSSRPYALVLPTWLVLGFFFLLPLGIMLLISFAPHGEFGTEPIDNVRDYIHSGAWADNYKTSADPLFWRIFKLSTWLAVITTALCLLVSYPVAYYIAIVAKKKWRNTLLALVAIPFWTSFLIRTYSWMLILRKEGLLNSFLLKLHLISQPLELLPSNVAVLLGLVYGELPFMILPLYASLEKLDRTLLEAGNDLGAGRWGNFWRITVPTTMPGIIAGIVLVFIPSLGQFVVSDVLGGGKYMLVGNLIEGQFHGGRNPPFGSALAFELTAMVLLLLVVYGLYARKRGSEGVL